MAIEADHLHPVAARRSQPATDDRANAIARARRHTKVVRVLRVFLPVCALCIVALYFLSSKITISVGGMQASVQRIEVSKDRLRMVAPKMEGVTDKNGAYKVSADYAEQVPSDPSQVFLTAVRAEVTDASQGWSLMTAPKGKFDTKEEALTLSGDIKVTSSAGITAYLSKAGIDMRGQTVVSDQPVKVTFPEGTLDSRTMLIEMAKNSITFEHDVRVHGQARPKQDAGNAPANKPATGEKPLALALSRDKPIDIAAPKLTIYDKQKLAHFTGGVVTEQDGSRMLSQDLRVFYDGDTAGTKPSEGGAAAQGAAKLKRIEAGGNITITAADGRNATAQELSYDAATRQLTLDGNVVLVQQGNRLSGARMIADLASNVTRFPPAGRVMGRFAAREGQTSKPKPGNKPSSLLVGGSQLDLSSTRGQPVDVVADSLEVDDNKKMAVFRGDVRTSQGGMKLRSKALKVNYGGGGEAEAKASVSTIRAIGPVLITTDQNQTATSDWALFDSRKQNVTIGGNVVLSQGENVIKGDRLVIDLTTGRSRFENSVDARTGQRPRVKGLFLPRQQPKANGNPKPGPAPLR